jgi:hypothetical protein
MLGDHIRALKGGRWIHGIDGGDKTVLHLGDRPGPRVLRTYGPLFVEGAEAVEVVAHREPVYPPRSVVARAWSPVRDPALGEMFGDSEAFAHWCKSGRLPEGAATPPAAGGPAPEAARGARPTPTGGAARPPAKPSGPGRKPAGKARGPTARKTPSRKAPASRARKPPARKRPSARKARPKRRR